MRSRPHPVSKKDLSFEAIIYAEPYYTSTSHTYIVLIRFPPRLAAK
jgi:hypothetical protein